MNIDEARASLLERARERDNPRELLKDSQLKALYAEIPKLPNEQRGEFGRQINELKQALEAAIIERENAALDQTVEPIDVTAPFDINGTKPQLLPTENGTVHPLSREISNVIDIFTRMGFEAVESRQIDDDFHMFTSLNFPPGHPARDGYDTFRTEEGFIPPAHTSTMQNRILRAGRDKLESGGQIAAISYGRVFRNEDVDATHEHTFHQCEGVFVSSTASLSQMLGTLQAFFEAYYGQKLKTKTQPGYFPFTEPSLEFAIEKPASLGGSGKEWLEMLGCGMIHPNVLKAADIDPTKHRGFAWGGGLERLVMLKYGIEDLRHFESGKLAFLREFK
ncbi:MAG TPA: phenylalanine--tRNA ligase subunit alpha [Candidatus Nanoperiomorbaceae bacterium]|nr:phenylalanine--tRNA ligase subunit alpha [Candidatus Nanoperiomorbaceae bacterium]HMQ96484.1 phenylalanine--tRNA ligase subunit alpha [Candidatus Nanoperiomorbaceae bacterium]HMR85901.1 phenylalanine--tRNA ligase subunit alpha [Candidatus Nanoperiomorbaceae bacterium]HMU11760.1 phenylalanine--tRNA ligase subunit alpha [Candidatus Nanoperiomorbaceae bacterium]